MNILYPVLVLYATGLLMIFDASSGEMVDLLSSQSHYAGVVRQLIWGVCSMGAAAAAYKLGWKWFYDRASLWYVLLVVLLLCVFVPGIGVRANGARRWVGVHGLTIQPSEFVKIILPAYFVFLCAQDPSVFQRFGSYVRVLGKMALPIILIVLEPNNGTAGVIALTIGVMTLVVGIPARFWSIPLCVAALALGVFAASSGYVQRRISTYLHPECDIKGKGHQPYQAKIAAGSGGLFGRGPAKSMQKLSYLPEAQNDYIAAIFAEEFGFVGISLLMGVYVWLLHEVWRTLRRLVVPEAFAWGMAIFFLVSFQTFMNLGVVSGLLPSTGLNLPFFSQGGSSLLANAIGIGLLLSMEQSKEVLCIRRS